MATKRTTKTSKTKTSKHLEAQHKHFGTLVVVFGVLLICILAVFFYAKSNRDSYVDDQKLRVFDSLLEDYIYEQFSEGEGESARITGSGVSEDKDLYYNFIRMKYNEEHIPISTQKARIYFQCHDENFKPKENGCAFAYSYEDWVDTTEEYRNDYQAYLDLLEEYTEKGNATEDEKELEKIKKEYQEATKKYSYLFE